MDSSFLGWGQGAQLNANLVVAMSTIAAILVFVPYLWRFMGFLVTLVHEMAHASAGLMVMRIPTGLRIDGDLGGEMRTFGNGSRLACGWVAWWGYPGPAIYALVSLFLLSNFPVAGVLFLYALTSIYALLLVRNLGALIASGAATGLCWMLWSTHNPKLQGAFVVLVSTVLILGSARGMIPLIKVHLPENRHKIEQSDALTVWRTVFIPTPVTIALWSLIILWSAQQSVNLLLQIVS